MSLQVILVMVYLVGEFGYIMYVENAVSFFQVAGDSPKKNEQMERANKGLWENILYRNSLQNPARVKADGRIHEFESYTGTKFTDIKPGKGMWSKWLWRRAKNASDIYKKIKSDFDHEKLCQSSMSDGICAKALIQNPYFENEQLTYDDSNSITADECTNEIPLSMLLNQITVELDYMVQYKMCLVKKRNSDGTTSSVKIYFQSAYRQPFREGWLFFVLFAYNLNRRTGQWERPSNPNDDTEAKFRYEAFLYIRL